MESTLNYTILRSEVIGLTSVINLYFTKQYNAWERKTNAWVGLKAHELLPSGDREHLVDAVSKDTPHLLLQQLSDEWPIEDGIIEALVADINRKTESLIEKFGDRVTLEIVNETKKWLKAKAAELLQVEFEGSLRTLDWLYEDAKEVTIIEFLTRSNHKDVIEYHEELNKKLWEMHFEAIEWHEAKILSEVAEAMENITNHI